MTSAQLNKAHGSARKLTHATGKKTTPKRAIGRENKTTPDPRDEFSDEEWQAMVATAAYFRAESRGFDERRPEDDWYEAEAELRERLTRVG